MFTLGHSAGCGITDEISQWMESIQNSGIEEEPEEQNIPPPIPVVRSTNLKNKHRTNNKGMNKKLPKSTVNNYVDEYPSDKYSREANEPNIHTREKRATRLREDRNTCSLYIQTDPLIWKHIREGFPEVWKFVFSIVIHIVCTNNQYCILCN